MTPPKEPPPLEVRWDPAYSGGEFVPDHDDTYTGLKTAYGNLAKAAGGAVTHLGKAVPGTWKGDAAVAYGDFIGTVVNYLKITGQSTATATVAAGVTGGNISIAETAASTAAGDANEVQSKRKQEKEKDELGIFESIQFMMELSFAVSNGNEARADAVKSNKQLLGALDEPDHNLATAEEPQVPNPLDASDPKNAGLLATIFQPVSEALEKLGDTADSRAAVDAYERAMEEDPSGAKAKALLAKYATTLSAKELDFFLNNLDEDDLAAAFANLDPKTDREIYNAIANKASTSILIRLAETDPNHYWHPRTHNDDAYNWSVPTGRDPLSSDPNALHQGDLGDCTTLSLLGAINRADPDFLSDHVRRNANGTYTVTLYKDGQPIEVTVTPDMPYKVGSDGAPTEEAYADSSIFAIYEKALAQSNAEIRPDPDPDGGYDSLGPNIPDQVESITGSPGHPEQDATDVSADDMKASLDAHQPVTVFVPTTSDIPEANGQPDRQIIGGHAYYVQDVNPDSDPPTVTLVNPWGSDNDPDGPDVGTITLSWDEYEKYVGKVQTQDPP